jgi:hypothetical protein
MSTRGHMHAWQDGLYPSARPLMEQLFLWRLGYRVEALSCNIAC